MKLCKVQEEMHILEAGHSLMYEDPEGLNSLLEEFIAKSFS
jgi:hypothetical protein